MAQSENRKQQAQNQKTKTAQTSKRKTQNHPAPMQFKTRQNVQSAAPRTLTAEEKRARLRRKKERIRRQKRQRRIIAAVFLVMLIGAFLLIRQLNGSSDTVGQTELDDMDLATTFDDQDEENYTGDPIANILFAGDISVDDQQVADATLNSGNFDFSQVFSSMKYYISSADYAVADFETTMVDDLDYGLSPYYNAPVVLAGDMHNLGFDLMSTANTYMLNNGIEGLVSTKNYLNEAKLHTVGTYESQEERDSDGGAFIRTIHGIKFAFLAYTKGTDSVTLPSGCEYALNTLYTDYSDYWTDVRTSQIKADVEAAKDAGAEVIIALVHWGSEYGRTITTSQEEITELLLENGVDAIIGTHSHVVNDLGFQTVTLNDGTKKKCFVGYSIGDFYTDPEKDSGKIRAVLNLEFTRGTDDKVTITDAYYIPLYMNITETDGAKHFELLDVYSTLATLARDEGLTSDQMLLYNELLDCIDTLHTYAGEDLDRGPLTDDIVMVQTAITNGAFSDGEIESQQEEETDDEEPADTTDTGETTDADTTAEPAADGATDGTEFTGDGA